MQLRNISPLLDERIATDNINAPQHKVYNEIVPTLPSIVLILSSCTLSTSTFCLLAYFVLACIPCSFCFFKLVVSFCILPVFLGAPYAFNNMSQLLIKKKF